MSKRIVHNYIFMQDIRAMLKSFQHTFGMALIFHDITAFWGAW